MVLNIKNLVVKYGQRHAVDHVSFSIGQDLMGILGPNGAGKTTMFRAIMGLQEYTGDIEFFNNPDLKIRQVLPLISYVPQKLLFEPNFPATIRDIISLGIISDKKRKAAEKAANVVHPNPTIYKSKQDKINSVLEKTGIAHLANRRIGELSGGEQQRVFISMGLINEPLLMILDEPVAGVDAGTQRKFYEIISDIHAQGTSIIWSSHDLNAVKEHAGIVACMNRSMIYHGEKSGFFKDPNLVKKYTESAMQMHMHDHDGGCHE